MLIILIVVVKIIYGKDGLNIIQMKKRDHIITMQRQKKLLGHIHMKSAIVTAMACHMVGNVYIQKMLENIIM